LLYPSLKGKTRKEIGLEPFTCTEIRSSICGIPVVIVQWQIASVLGIEASGKYSGIDISSSEEGFWKEKVNMVMYNSTQAGKYADLSIDKKLLLKIQNENLLPKGGGDKPTLAKKVLLQHFIKGEKVNVPKYMFKHLIDNLRKSQLENRPWVPYGRLLSEIFYQGDILDRLSSVGT
jgi:hypothetical protein